MERLRSIKITIEADTNKRTVVEEFHDADDAVEWLREQRFLNESADHPLLTSEQATEIARAAFDKAQG